MGKYTFVELDKSDTAQILPNLFSILYNNMNRIAPSGCSYAEDEAMWLAYMEQQMHLPYPKIILMYVHDALAGYFQYSVSGNTLMVDEVEIKHEYQRTMLFFSLCRYLCEQLLPKVEYIEAYVNKGNSQSLRINKKLGLEIVGENKSGRSWLLRGYAKDVGAYFQHR